MLNLKDIEQAQKTIYEHMLPSPQISWPLLNNTLGSQVIVKHENANPTTAFKVRGGLVIMEKISQMPSIKGVISATKGNHGQSLAWGGKVFGVKVTIVVPRNNSVEKNNAIKALGAKLIEEGEDFDEARAYAQKIAQEQKFFPVASFAPELLQGVATYHFELLEAHKDLEAYFIPIGMGSGICSAIQVRDLLGLKTKIYGVVAKGADAMYQSFKAKKIICKESVCTHADGIACKQPHPKAFRTILKGAEDILVVDDDAIARAISLAWKTTHQLLEGAGAASLAGALACKQHNTKLGVVFSGGNIDQKLFLDWVMPFFQCPL